MKILAGVLLSSLALGSYSLNAADFGVGVKAGTLGYGADFSVSVTRTINARVSLTTLSIDSQSESVTVGDSTNQGTINATADIDFGSSALLFDWYVFDGAFHLTAGMVKADVSASLRGTLADDFSINGNVVDPSDIVGGVITGDITVSDSYKPYIGLGWGRKAAADPGFSFSAEIGVALVDPEVNLRATASAPANQANLNQQLQDAQASADNDLADLNIWPVLSIGINYAF